MVPIVLLVLLTQGPSDAAQVVRVAAAADLKFALDDIAARLAKRQPAIRVQSTYGSSGVMHAQLRQRAPYDVFLSADIDYPRDLVSRGIGSDHDLFTYATGRIVVWVPASSALPVERDGLRALAGARRIAIANPRHAPYGKAAEAALLPVGPDARVPMRQIYELFRGVTTPEAVSGAAGAQPAAQFYAQLYLGLYFEALGDARRALDRITSAAAPRYANAGGYMHTVARVHLSLLQKRTGP